MSFSSWAVFALGRSTSTPDDNIGVTTMKMISSTSTTSTSGVTLMSAIAPPFFPPTFAPIFLPPRRRCRGRPLLGRLALGATQRVLLGPVDQLADGRGHVL